MARNKVNTVSVVTELAQPIAKELGFTIWDVQFVKEGTMWILRVVIDKEGGITIDDCEAMSRPLDKKLDEIDPIEQSYCLEVSSAGIERELSKDWHFEQFIGSKVVVHLIRPYEKNRDFIGELISYKDNSVSVNVDGNEYTFAMTDVSYVRLYAEI